MRILTKQSQFLGILLLESTAFSFCRLSKIKTRRQDSTLFVTGRRSGLASGATRILTKQSQYLGILLLESIRFSFCRFGRKATKFYTFHHGTKKWPGSSRDGIGRDKAFDETKPISFWPRHLKQTQWRRCAGQMARERD
jgi:hypothetical protein